MATEATEEAINLAAHAVTVSLPRHAAASTSLFVRAQTGFCSARWVSHNLAGVTTDSDPLDSSATEQVVRRLSR